jgi:hypothetical protein
MDFWRCLSLTFKQNKQTIIPHLQTKQSDNHPSPSNKTIRHSSLLTFKQNNQTFIPHLQTKQSDNHPSPSNKTIRQSSLTFKQDVLVISDPMQEVSVVAGQYGKRLERAHGRQGTRALPVVSSVSEHTNTSQFKLEPTSIV